jgi:hypothetical protein
MQTIHFYWPEIMPLTTTKTRDIVDHKKEEGKKVMLFFLSLNWLLRATSFI